MHTAEGKMSHYFIIIFYLTGRCVCVCVCVLANSTDLRLKTISESALTDKSSYQRINVTSSSSKQFAVCGMWYIVHTMEMM